MKAKLILSILFVTSLFFVTAESFSGKSDYKLLFMNHQGPEFDPNQDLLKPTETEIQIEKVQEVVGGSVLKSFLPMMNVYNASSAEGNDLLSSLMTTASALSLTLSEELKKIEVTKLEAFPVIQDVFLVPWKTKERDLFYSAEKISMNAGEVVNVLGISPGSAKFDKLLTQNLKDLQAKLYKTSKDPAFLLGFRAFLFVHVEETKLKKKKVSGRLTLRAIVGLKPGKFPFTKKDGRVSFKNVVIPDIEGRGSVASLTFNLDLSEKPEAPSLDLEFGDFDRFEDGDFVVIKKGKSKSTPRLVGSYSLVVPLPLNVSFGDLNFNLLTQSVPKIQTLVSTRFGIGKNPTVSPGIHLTLVDKQLQAEINKTIEAELKASGDSFLNKIFGERI